MPSTFKLFKKKSRIVDALGPSADEQFSALINDKYWTILNSSILKSAAVDEDLVVRVSALKHALQTYGPQSEKLPDLRANKGGAEGSVFHGHVKDSRGTTYVLEWAVIDPRQKLISLVGFGSHENYAFRQSALNKDYIERVMSSTETQSIMALVEKKVKEAKAKAARLTVMI